MEIQPNLEEEICVHGQNERKHKKSKFLLNSILTVMCGIGLCLNLENDTYKTVDYILPKNMALDTKRGIIVPYINGNGKNDTLIIKNLYQLVDKMSIDNQDESVPGEYIGRIEENVYGEAKIRLCYVKDQYNSNIVGRR